MLDLERVKDPDGVLRLALEAWQTKIWTAMPGIVEAFDADTNTASVRVAVMGQLRALVNGKRTGPYQNVRIPLLVQCPVQFGRGSGLCLTFPLAAGDEGLVVFASRCIDGWWESGGEQPQAEIRMHDLSDGFFIPGVSSKPNAISNVSGSAAQLRNADGTVFVEVSPTGVKIKGPLEVEGDVNVTGNTEFTGTVKANGLPIDETHRHSGVTVGGGNSGPVIP